MWGGMVNIAWTFLCMAHIPVVQNTDRVIQWVVTTPIQASST